MDLDGGEVRWRCIVISHILLSLCLLVFFVQLEPAITHVALLLVRYHVWTLSHTHTWSQGYIVGLFLNFLGLSSPSSNADRFLQFLVIPIAGFGLHRKSCLIQRRFMTMRSYVSFGAEMSCRISPMWGWIGWISFIFICITSQVDHCIERGDPPDYFFLLVREDIVNKSCME